MFNSRNTRSRQQNQDKGPDKHTYKASSVARSLKIGNVDLG